MRLFIVGVVGQCRTFEILEYNPETHVAVLRNEVGEECIDPNFHVDDVMRRLYRLEKRED